MNVYNTAEVNKFRGQGRPGD